MKKNVLKICVLFLALPVLFLTACAFPPVGGASDGVGENAGDAPSDFFMIAKVENLADPFQVSVIESEYASGPFWLIPSETIVYESKGGERITKSDVKVGDTVKIYYSGQIMMSYPPQVVALKIVLEDR